MTSQSSTARLVAAFALVGSISTNLFAGPIADTKALYVDGYHTGISPGLELLIDQSLRNDKAKKTLILLDSELTKDPTNTTLLYKKASIYADQGDWSNTLNVLDKIKSLQPGNTKANKLRLIVDKKRQAEPHNELGFDLNESYVSDLKAYWNYSSIHYYRLTDGGKFGGHINYANRYGGSALQYQLEAYPKVSDNAYAELSFRYAKSSQILFPSLQYMLEGYIDTAHNLEFSLGQGGKIFNQFSNQKIFKYTGTIGKYIGDSYLWFRPNFYTPKSTLFYQLGLRKYFSDTNNYITIIVGAGKLPDIGDVPPLDQMITLTQKGFGINGQISLTKTVFLKGGIGYAKQTFPSGLIREITDGSIGMVWRI